MVVCNSPGLKESINPCFDSVCELESEQPKVDERRPVLFVLVPLLSRKRSINFCRNNELSVIRFVRSPRQDVD
jgi:hypothetical protein